MNCIVGMEGRFHLTDGKPSSPHLNYHRFWRRYLDVFDSVTVVARLYPVEEPSASPVEGPGVTFFPLPGYTGPLEFLRNLRRLQNRIHTVCADESALIARCPGRIGSLLIREYRRQGRPFGVEVVGDPFEVHAPGSVSHPLRRFFRWWFPRQLRKQCAMASGVAYVTESVLQSRYPAAPEAFTTHYSSIELPASSFRATPREFTKEGRSFTLILVGSLAQLYKAPDVLIDAVACCVEDGMDIRLVIVGEGKHRRDLEARAERHGLESRVAFRGHLPPGDSVRAELDKADLFVLPSKTEGLPRAMIEAMARGLPCIGSTAGGIPELLAAEDVVAPGEVGLLGEKIKDVLKDTDRMNRMSARNHQKAAEYRYDVLQERRIAFYRHVRETTEAYFGKKCSL